MKWILSVILFVLVFASCNEEDSVNIVQEEGFDYKEYFFPSDSLIPYIYVFQGTHNPLDEKFFRIYRLQDDRDTSLIVERYNANFRITEGFTHNLKDSLKLTDYMIVDGDGIKRKANLLSNRTFPLGPDDISYFVSDFPGPADSITMIYESKKSISDLNMKKIVMGDTIDAIKLIDSVKVHLVNPYTKASKTEVVVTNRYYAKGYGLVEWGSDKLNTHYRLEKILSNDWWAEFAQGPQVKM